MKLSDTMKVTAPTDLQIEITRQVDAPRQLVFEAWTNPAYLPRWMLGPPGWTMPVCEIDLRIGGSWHFVWRNAEGTELPMHGVYKEIMPPKRLVNTESWGADWPETLNTLTLAEKNGKTTITLQILYPSKEARDAVLKTGMADGMTATFDRLEAMFQSPQIVPTAAQPIAFIHLTIPRSEIRHVMGPGLNEIMAALGQQGIAPAGPWFTHHLKIEPETFDFEICVPVAKAVAKAVAAVGRVKPGERPTATVARSVYRGPYEGLATAWQQFDAWIRSSGHKPAADLYECYIVGPESSPDPADWRTLLDRPIGFIQ